ncbi:MAG TPA: hypothetical protein VFS09_06390 [Candidatus Eisenbacteria bacterium]|nr:hypothetical protein [Candidatus Eisenbacteria bacterium]
MASRPDRPSRAREWRLFAIWYLAGFVLLLALLVAMFGLRGATVADVWERVPRILRWIARRPLGYLLAAVPYLLFIVGRSLVREHRRGGVRALAMAAATRVALPAAALAALGLGYRAYRSEGPVPWSHDPTVQNESGRSRDLFARDGKMRGVNLVAGRRMGEAVLPPLIRDNVEWISVTPFGWQENLASTVIESNGEAGYWSESDSGVVELARMAHARGMRVALKPHLWVTGGGASKLAELDPGSAAGWRSWFASYRAFLLRYAALAESAHVDLLIVGAELTRASTRHPDEWRALIAETRRVYRGPLTYAANWYEEAEGIAFWDALDYISVQAYYPLAEKGGADRAALERGWSAPLRTLEALHEKWGKKVIFTEVGWKSTADAAVRPWEWTEDSSQLLSRVSTRAQADAYDAFFRAVWPKPWFAGAFVWKWYGRHERAGGADDIDFTPQNKPAEGVIARAYGAVAGKEGP